MRWKTKPIPSLGDTRWVKKFAWFPVETDSGDILWLESYYVKEVFSQKLGLWGWSACVNDWYPFYTVTPEEYDKLMQEEQFLTAITTSGNFTLEKAKLETINTLIYYDKEKK